MQFTLMFLELFYYGLLLTAPILFFLALLVVVLGQIAGKLESWGRGETLYWSFITATTVGYGDYRPLNRLSRFLSVMIAFCGVIFTGIFVSIAIASTTRVLEQQYDLPKIEEMIEQRIE